MNTKILTILATVAISIATSAWSADATPPRVWAGEAPGVAISSMTCPPSGFHKPIWGAFGGNDGIRHPYEIAGPCYSQLVKDAALANGLLHSKPSGLKAVMSTRFSATGTWVDPVAGPIRLETLTMHNHYFYPGSRTQVWGTRANGEKYFNSLVVNDGRAWDETVSRGVGPRPAPAGAERERAVYNSLLPQGAMLSIVEAEGTAKAGKDSQGRNTITGKSPFEPWTVTVTLDDRHRIIRSEVRYGGDTYVADFIGYHNASTEYDPVGNKWEPSYLVDFPDRLVWTKNGRPMADLTTTEMKSNPYVVLPYPEFLKAEIEPANPSFGYDKNNPGDDPRGLFEQEAKGVP